MKKNQINKQKYREMTSHQTRLRDLHFCTKIDWVLSFSVLFHVCTKIDSWSKDLVYSRNSTPFIGLSFVYNENTGQNWCFVTKIVLTSCEKNYSNQRICKLFEITKTIYFNSERSEQVWVTDCYFILFLEVSHT